MVLFLSSLFFPVCGFLPNLEGDFIPKLPLPLPEMSFFFLPANWLIFIHFCQLRKGCSFPVVPIG